MLNKKSVKVISIILLAVMLLCTLSTTVFADVNVPAPSDVDTGALNETVGNVLGLIKWGGLVAAVIVAMFIGIKYITASPDGKAEIKKTVGFYVAGIVILLSASGIVTWIQTNLKI